MSQAVFLTLAFATGLMIPFQLAFNAQLGIAVKSPLTGAFFVFAVGLVASVLVILFSRAPLPNLAMVGKIPPTAWIGGIIATLYIVAVVFLVPRIGVGMTAVLVVAGQLVGALILDHFGAFGAPQSPISLLKGIGLILIVSGAALIKTG